MSDKFEIVYRSVNPVEAEVIENMLREEGFAARLIGTRLGALIGVSDLILQLRIEVPEEESSEARELIRTLLESGQPVIADGGADGESEYDEEYDDDDDDDENDDTFTDRIRGQKDGEVARTAKESERRTHRSAGAVKSRMVAAGIPFLIPGGAHFYLQRRFLGGALLCYVFAGLTLMVAGQPEVGVALYVGALLSDLLLAQLTFPTDGRPTAVSTFGQFLFSLLIGVILAAVGVILRPLPQQKGPVNGINDTDVQVQYPLEIDTDLLDFRIPFWDTDR